MNGAFRPGGFVAMMACVCSDRIPRSWSWAIFGLGMLLGLAFVVLTPTDRGTEEIFRIGHYPAYDGCGLKPPTPGHA